MYPEQVVVAAAARRLQRPVVWTSTRSEDMVALSHSRGQIQYVELGCKRDGTFTGLRVRLVGDGGAYPGIGAYLPAGTRRMSNGTYRFTGIQFDLAVAATNTTPMGAYRGAGRPEATALLERVVDQAAHRAGHRPDRTAPAQPARPTTCSRSPRSPASPTTAARTARHSTRPPGWPATTSLRAEQAARRERGDRKLLGIGVSPTSRSPPAVAPASTARSRSTTTARPPSSPARRRTARATRPRSR